MDGIGSMLKKELVDITTPPKKMKCTIDMLVFDPEKKRGQ
jgi:hypothetical protein